MKRFVLFAQLLLSVVALASNARADVITGDKPESPSIKCDREPCPNSDGRKDIPKDPSPISKLGPNSRPSDQTKRLSCEIALRQLARTSGAGGQRGLIVGSKFESIVVYDAKNGTSVFNKLGARQVSAGSCKGFEKSQNIEDGVVAALKLFEPKHLPAEIGPVSSAPNEPAEKKQSASIVGIPKKFDSFVNARTKCAEAFPKVKALEPTITPSVTAEKAPKPGDPPQVSTLVK